MTYILENNEEYTLVNTHPEYSCSDQPACPIHKKSNHSMRSFPQWFRSDNGLMERTCPHGIGHPDPDGLHFFEAQGIEGMDVHGCDGCCIKTTHAVE